MRNLLETASVAQILDGAPSDGEPAFPPVLNLSVGCGGLQQPAAFSSFVAEKVTSLRLASHLQRLRQELDHVDQRLDERRPLPAGSRGNGKHRGRSLVSAHLSSPDGVETTLGCTAADRAVIVRPDTCRRREQKLLGIDIRQQPSARKAG